MDTKIIEEMYDLLSYEEFYTFVAKIIHLIEQYLEQTDLSETSKMYCMNEFAKYILPEKIMINLEKYKTKILEEYEIEKFEELLELEMEKKNFSDEQKTIFENKFKKFFTPNINLITLLNTIEQSVEKIIEHANASNLEKDTYRNENKDLFEYSGTVISLEDSHILTQKIIYALIFITIGGNS